MKLTLVCALAAASLVSSIAVGDADLKQEVLGAVKALGEKENYNWRTTTIVPPESGFKPGPIEGRAEKKGLTSLTLKVRDTTTLAFLQGDKAVASTEAGGWQSDSDRTTTVEIKDVGSTKLDVPEEAKKKLS